MLLDAAPLRGVSDTDPDGRTTHIDGALFSKSFVRPDPCQTFGLLEQADRVEHLCELCVFRVPLFFLRVLCVLRGEAFWAILAGGSAANRSG